MEAGYRIAKVMARAGLCSRRDAEEWILAGRVSVNGEVLTSPARDVLQTDAVIVDGVPLPMRERTRLFLYHKPRGLVTTARDPEGRPTVFANLPKGLPRVISIGRLDINTEGLLLLTNDGGLARIIELPETGWLRRYRVRCFGEVNQATLDTLRGGITVDDMHYGPIEATLDREKGDNVWLTLGLREGKNREVKRVLEHLGLAVNRLIRLSFGPFQLGELAEGAVEEIRTGHLRDQLGPSLIEAAGADFDAPVFIHDQEPEEIVPAPSFERERPERDRPERERSDHHAGGAERRGRPNRRPSTGPRPSRPEANDRQAQDDEPAKLLAPRRRSRLEPQRSIWRADDAELIASTRATPKVPRRGQDPKTARIENAAREHKRAGSITTRGGKTIMVEKLAPTARKEEVRGETPSKSASVRSGMKGRSAVEPRERTDFRPRSGGSERSGDFGKPDGKPMRRPGGKPFGKSGGPRPPRAR